MLKIDRPRRLITFSLLLLLIIFTAPMLSACNEAESGKAAVVVEVLKRDTDEPVAQFKGDIVTSPEAQAKGLMHREAIADDYGMLFLFPQPDIARFWMKNTPIFLDMIFITEAEITGEGKISKIHENAIPFDEETQIASDQPVIAVLEIKGGGAAEHNIAVGDRVRWTIKD